MQHPVRPQDPRQWKFLPWQLRGHLRQIYKLHQKVIPSYGVVKKIVQSDGFHEIFTFAIFYLNFQKRVMQKFMESLLKDYAKKY
jgi:hypothetical protein